MKNTIIGAIITIFLGGLAAKYIFNKTIELKYALSEKISADFTSKSEEAIQQLKIKNNGDVLIKNIVIKINEGISKWHIKKHKHNDSVSISPKNKSLEILYSELPPTGEIIIVLKSSSNGINSSKIKVSHSEGKATEVFSKNTADEVSGWTIVFLVCVAFMMMSASIYNFLSESHSHKIYLDPYKHILQHKKPPYIENKKWFNLREDAKRLLFQNDFNTNIEHTLSYQLLNSDKKDFFSDDEWLEVIEKAEDQFSKNLAKNIYTSHYSFKYDEIESLQKPKNISDINWKDIKSKMSEAVCLKELRLITRHPYLSKIVEFLETKKPDLVNDDDWDNLRKSIQELYIAKIITDGIQRYNYDDFLKSINLDLLDTKAQDNIKSFFEALKKNKDYQKYNILLIKAINQVYSQQKLPENIQELEPLDAKIIEELHTKLEDSKKQQAYYFLLVNTIRASFSWKTLPQKTTELEQKDWDEIANIFKQVVSLEAKAEQALAKTEDIKREFFPKSIQVTKQFDIIDQLLKDPHSIDRVEQYNVPFSDGNWENLLALSKHLQNINS